MSQPQPINVLLIEDNPDDARLVELYLDRAEHEDFLLERADRLAGGIRRLLRGGIAVVLLDLRLPDSQGLQTFERVYAQAPEVPIVVMTGIDDAQLALRAVRDGAQDYLVKRDVDTNLLVRSIRYAIERKRYEEKLRESEERYSLAVSGANDGVWDWNIESDEIYFSPRWKEMLGYGPEELQARPDEWFSRVHPDDLDQLRKDINDHLAGRTEHFKSEYRMRHRDGRYLWMLSRGISVIGPSGAAYRMAGSLTDIHRRKMTEAQLLHDAMHDALTDLPNWALFMDRLGMAIAQSKRYEDHMFAVLFLDLDRFKNINDSLGHAVGDRLLLAIARRLRTFLRPGDTVARLGGDEFAILVNAIEDPSHATRIAERIHEELGMPFDLQGHEVFASMSIGIALSADQYERPEEMLRDADTAMYRAKSLGKAGHAIFDKDMHRRAVQILRLETDLRRALERHEFRLHYQPIISLEHGQIEGFEALLRWQHPEKGLVYPADFIPMAEETGLIVPIGWGVLREACAQIALW
ncbi:MAG: diguanylate cyclase, partial [Thermoanaerobaculia bacterium]